VLVPSRPASLRLPPGALCGLALAALVALAPQTPAAAAAEKAQKAASGARLEPSAILVALDASPIEAFAAREVRRYFYLRTGTVLPIVHKTDAPAIVVGRANANVVRLVADEKLTARLAALQPEERLLVSVPRRQPPALLVAGGDDAGVLYAAYRMAEHLGVGFGLHGDTLPDARQPAALPELDEEARPLFALRGIQPFHDFPEGPDWWTRDDYKAVLAQLPKLGMNFVGLHTYPEGRPNAEPTVWIGPPEEAGAGTEVKQAYPASYFSNLRGNWGYDARRTGDYFFGAGLLFDRDDYGNDVMEGLAPQPRTPDEQRTLFARAADVLRDAFTFARRLSVRTCAGTETPLVVPRAVALRQASAGRPADDAAGRQRLYEGIFRRIAQSYPLDYYWFWTPEGWTWEGVPDAEVRSTLGDLRSALAAAKAAHAPFALATCGWVLGPPQDRTLFDRELPGDVALSCINRTVGHSPVERGFATVKGRPTWAIPWLEDDPALTSPQLWVGRLRRDAADARRYGASGLIGIHWRTRAIGPAVAALAQAGWRQDWTETPAQVEGPVGGYPLVRADAAVAGTREPDLYRHQRCGLAGYRLKLPNGRYDLHLRFAELQLARAGERVFDVTVQGRTVATNVDLARSPGPRTAFDHVVRGVGVHHGWLDVGFVDHQNVACLAAIEVEGRTARRIDVGGPALAGWEADLEGVPFVPTTDFWSDWAAGEFGAEAGKQAASIFERLDSRLPRPVDWVDGPGGLVPDARPWWQAKADYAFVDQLAALRPVVDGPLSLERFDYWLESFRYLRATGELACAYARLQEALGALRAAPAADRRRRAEAALVPLRAMVPLVGAAMHHLLATVRTRGELGTVANWQQHLLPRVYEAAAREIAEAFGGALPPEAVLPRTYDGPDRLVVPTLRTALERGEPLRLEALVFGEVEGAVQLTWRRMGSGTWTPVPFTRVARGVYRVTLPAPADDIEYFVQATPVRGGLLKVPAAGSAVPQTVVIGP